MLIPGIIVHDLSDAVISEKTSDLINRIRQDRPTVLDILQLGIGAYLTTENDANRSRAIELLGKVNGAYSTSNLDVTNKQTTAEERKRERWGKEITMGEEKQYRET